MAILTLATYKIYANIINALADSRLTQIINAAEPFFLMKLKRNIEDVKHQEYYDGDGTTELVLNNYPVISITELKINDEVINSQYYKIKSDEGIIHLVDYSYLFSSGIQNVYIDYNSGYATPPKEIEMAIAELVSKKYETFDKEKGNAFSSEAFLGGSIVFKDTDLTDYAKEVINAYRKKGRRN